MKRKNKILFQLLLCLVAPVLVGCPERDNVADDYVGEWWNDDRETDYITRIIITPYDDDDDDMTMHVQVFAACVPDECDWGIETAWFHQNFPTYELQSKYEFASEEVWVMMDLDRSTHVLTVLESHVFGRFEDDDERNWEIVHSFHEYG